jgi:hypothetical protein
VLGTLFFSFLQFKTRSVVRRLKRVKHRETASEGVLLGLPGLAHKSLDWDAAKPQSACVIIFEGTAVALIVLEAEKEPD